MSSYYEKILATGEVKCIDEEVPFEIPQGWEWCRMRDVIYPPKYGTSSKSLSNGDVPVLRMGNIQDGKVVYDKLVFSNNVEDNRKYLLQDGDLLFNRTNSAELVGKTAIFKGNRHVIYAGYLILLRPIKTNSEYLNYIFSSPYVRSYCKEVKTIGVQQCNINAEKVSQLLVPIAPFEEQMRIVDKIKEVQSWVDKYSNSQYSLDLLNVSLSERLKKSILQEAIQGRLVPQIAEECTAKELLEQIKKEKQKLVKEGKLKKSALATSVIFRGDDNKYYEKIGKKCVDITEEIPFPIPANWQWIRLDQGISLLSGRDLDPSQYNELHHGIPYITGASNFVNSSLLINRWTDSPMTIANKGDLLLTCKGTIGSMAFNDIGQIHIARQVMAITSFGIDLKYIKCFLQGNLSILEKNANSMIPGISRSTLLGMLFPLPPFKEQQRIVAQIEKLFEQLH